MTNQASITLKTWTYSHKDKYQTLIHVRMHDHDSHKENIFLILFIYSQTTVEREIQQRGES